MKDLFIKYWTDINFEESDSFVIGVDSYSNLHIYEKGSTYPIVTIATPYYRNPKDKIVNILKLYNFNVIFE